MKADISDCKKMFKKDVADYRQAFQTDGYINLKDVLTDEFIAHLRSFLTSINDGERDDLPANRMPGHKRQYKFEFPSRETALEFRDALCALSGLSADNAVLSERHLMIYEGTSKAYPYPHKDRAASGLTVGFPIDIPKESAVYVFPDMDRTENLNEKASYLGEDAYENPREIYNRADAVCMKDELGDMVVFMGSTIFHARVHPANTAVLYCKMNDVGRDPLGEDIFHTELAET